MIYVVRAGDTPASIAYRFSVPAEAVVQANPQSSFSPGEYVNVPTDLYFQPPGQQYARGFYRETYFVPREGPGALHGDYVREEWERPTAVDYLRAKTGVGQDPSLDFVNTRDYTVVFGDSPASIAKKFSIDMDSLLAANPSKPTKVVAGTTTWQDLSVGEVLNIPTRVQF